jgi:hypothetical protein
MDLTSNLLLLAVQLASGNTISIQKHFDAEFHGYYSFTRSNGEKLELLSVHKDAVATIGTGSIFPWVVKFAVGPCKANVGLNFKETPLVLVRAPKYGNHMLFVVRQEPWVMHGEYSRPFPQ